jgi:hypothetical protein
MDRLAREGSAGLRTARPAKQFQQLQQRLERLVEGWTQG